MALIKQQKISDALILWEQESEKYYISATLARKHFFGHLLDYAVRETIFNIGSFIFKIV